jgi:hypothetical protein
MQQHALARRTRTIGESVSPTVVRVVTDLAPVERCQHERLLSLAQQNQSLGIQRIDGRAGPDPAQIRRAKRRRYVGLESRESKGAGMLSAALCDDGAGKRLQKIATAWSYEAHRIDA